MTLQDIKDIYNDGQGDWSAYVHSSPQGDILIKDNHKEKGPIPIALEVLIIRIKYNFIPTLLQSTKFTDAFWEWMKERHMAYYSEEYNQWMIRAENIVMIFPTPQMLTGYIIEYMQELL
jgi:hypothetical protein